MAENTELRESRDLMADLIEKAKTLSHDSDIQKDILKLIRNTQRDITSELKTQNEEQKALKNIQTQISNIAREIEDEYKRLNQGSADALENLVELHRDLAEKVKQEASMSKDMAHSEAARSNIIVTLNRLGFERAINLTKELNTMWAQSPMLAVANGVIIAFQAILKIFDPLDKAAADFRISMGFTRTATKGIEADVRTMYFQLAQTGITADDLYKSFQAISTSLGSAYFTTKEMAAEMGLLSAQLGVAQTTSAEFARVMGMMSRSTMDSQRNIALFTSKLSEAAGTNLNEVMSDVANASKSSFQFLVRNPAALAKAAVEAKRMGTSLSDAARSADSLIKFTSSVESEMEASVLLGEAINLQRARELSYRKDLSGVNKEILEIAKKSRFEDLDPFQQEAVAKALGKSADELGKMLQADREISKLRMRDDLKSQVAEYDRLAAASDSVVRSVAEDQKLKLSILSNQKAIAAVTAAWSSIWQRLLEGPVTALSKILPVIAEWLGKINYYTKGWGAAVVGLVAGLGLIVGARGLGKIVAWATGGIGKSITNLFGGISGGVKKFGDPGVLKGALGMLVVAASLIPLALALKIAQGVNWKTVAIMGVALVGIAAIATILGAPPIAVLAEAGAFVLITLGAAALIFAGAAYVFAAAIKSLDGVNIPKIAMGIASLGIAITPLALIAPLLPAAALGLGMFSVALRFTAGPAERMGKAAEMLGEGLQTTVSSLVALKNLDLTSTFKQLKNLSVIINEVSKSANAIPDIKIEKLQNVIIKAAEVGASEQSKNTEDVLKALDTIRASVDALRASMERGGIAANVSIDSQRLDSGVSRRLSFTGPLTPQPTAF